jgi:DNA-binding response OmpR family regulator
MLTETILLAQNKRLREENDELRETVRQLKETLTVPKDDLPPGLPHMSRSEQKVLRLLLSRQGTVLRERIYAALYDDDHHDPKMVDIWIHHVRRRLAGTSIIIRNDYGRGYYIDRGQTQNSGDVAQFVAEALAA